MRKLLGVVLNAAGVAALWFGGIPYTSKETVVKLGPLEAEAELHKKVEIPQPVGAGLVGAGTLLLLLPSGRKK